MVLGTPSTHLIRENTKRLKNSVNLTLILIFQLTTITDVKGKNAHPVYKWASEKLCSSAIPKWNFHKILINKHGKIEDTYSSLTKPTSKKIIKN